MADLKQSGQFLSKPSNEVNKKWLEIQIQEKKSQINRAKQDIEDFEKVKIVQLEALILMLLKDVEKLENDYKKLHDNDIIDVETNKND